MSFAGPDSSNDNNNNHDEDAADDADSMLVRATRPPYGRRRDYLTGRVRLLSNGTALVTYLHNKGLYHPSRENTALRRMLTTAIFSRLCQTISSSVTTTDPTTTNTTVTGTTARPPRCNVCAGQFTPLPHTHMTGYHLLFFYQALHRVKNFPLA